MPYLKILKTVLVHIQTDSFIKEILNYFKSTLK